MMTITPRAVLHESVCVLYATVDALLGNFHRGSCSFPFPLHFLYMITVSSPLINSKRSSRIGLDYGNFISASGRPYYRRLYYEKCCVM